MPIRERVQRPFLLATALVLSATALTGGQMATAAPEARAAGTPDLGPGTIVFTPDTPQATIQRRLDAIAERQVPSQFGTGRYAVYFAPGTYGSAAKPLRFELGYGTEVAGLGRSPKDVKIIGAVNVFNQCAGDPGGNVGEGCVALVNFWRSLSNLTIDPAGGEGCRADTQFWAVSQAAPMRRVIVTGRTTLQDYCSAPPQYASGGFVADSDLEGEVVNGGQQQWYTRDSRIGGWSNGVWNQAFSGVEGAPAQSFGDEGVADGGPQPYTTLERTPLSREKPYLYVTKGGAWRVFVPSARTATRGPAWAGEEPGRSLPLSSFRIVRPGDSAAGIDRALAHGKHLLITPGVYDIDRSLVVRKPGTVVLGTGIATLTARRGAVPLVIGDVPGVVVAGLLIDAGPTESPALLRVGTGGRGRSSAADPTTLQDVFFRVGGRLLGKAERSLVVDSDHVLLDHLWVWRADHGKGVGWTKNTGATGVLVRGDDVTATGLFVEHYQRYNVVWNGERGRTVFFQNELPYDPPTQAAWRRGKQQGYAAYKVGDGVRSHELWAGGAYIYTNVNPRLVLTSGFEVPKRPGVRLHDVLTVSLNKAGTIEHVVNRTGDAVTPTRQGPENLVAYP